MKIPKHNNQQSVLIINLERLKSNYKVAVKNLKPSAKCAATVKANAYGLGAIEICRALYEEGCRYFFVAYYNEALAIKDSAKDSEIYVIHGLNPHEYNDALTYNISPVLNTIADVERFNAFAKSHDKKLKAIVHVDTGMTRLGMTKSEFSRFVSDYDNFQHIEFTYIMSHLACAEEAANPLNFVQLERFESYTTLLPKIAKSFVNSSGIFLGEKFQFDLARPGCMLYGINPLMAGEKSPVKQVASLYGKVLQIRTLDQDQTVSYGGKYIAKKGSKIATICAGYADGYKRILTGNSHCYFNGARIPIDIRVTMDMLMIDVSNISEQTLSNMEYVELLGDNITVDELADNAKTIGYEILTSLSNRFNRVYE